MKDFQKLGGLAALYEAAAYIAGIVFFILIVDYSGVEEPMERVALLADHQTALYVMNLIIYVIFGVALVVLTLAVHERLQAHAPMLMKTATAFGLIWAGVVIASGMISNIGTGVVLDLYSTDPAQAATVWLAIDTVVNGIGGGVEVLGGLWVLLISWAALRTGKLARGLNYLGVVVGTAGIVTIIPALGEVGGMVFGLGQIVWFIWLGVLLIRRQSESVGPDSAPTLSRAGADAAG
jgi:hypothetical protein